MKKIIFLLIILFSFFTASSHAAWVDVTSGGKSGFWIDHSFYGNYTAKAGEFVITSSGLESAAFCVELGNPEAAGDADLLWLSSSSTPVDYPNAYYAAWLMDQYSTGLGYTGYTDKDIADAALQIAIWDTISDYNKLSNLYSGSIYENFDYDNNETPGDGDTTIDGDIEDQAWAIAETYIDALMTASSDGLDESDFSGLYRFAVADFETSQDLLVAQAVPVPSSIILLVSGLLGLSRIRRKQS